MSENGANTHSREAKKVESPAPMFASRAPSSSLGAHFFFAGTRARKEREKEGRRNRAMSTTNLLTESCVLLACLADFFFFSHVQRPRRDARETCFREGILDSFAGWKYLTSATSFFTAKGSVSGQRVAHSKRSVRDFLE